METSGNLGKRCLRRQESEEKQPRQPRQREPPTYGTVGTQAATRKSPRVGTSRASTSVGQTGIINSNGPRHPRQHRPPRRTSLASCRCGHRCPMTSPQSDDDDVDDEVAKIEAVRARRRAAKARYRARHPERIAEQRRRYRQRYRAEHLAYLKQYYRNNAERIREYKRQYYQTEAGQRWQAQYLARKRESAALLRQQRGPAVQKRTLQQIEALGPLKVTVMLEDFMTDFCNSLSPSPEDSMDQPGTITDMDSGVFHPLDHAVGDESSLSSSCDMWDDGKGFLDNLLEELDDLPPPSDDCWFDFLTDMMEEEEDSSFDLENFVT